MNQSTKNAIVAGISGAVASTIIQNPKVKEIIASLADKTKDVVNSAMDRFKNVIEIKND